MKTILAVVLLTFASSSVTAETITVCLDGSCDHTDIQEAIDVAGFGDVIEIAAGTYEPAKSIVISCGGFTVRGVVDQNGYPATIIDGQGAFRVQSARRYRNLRSVS